MVSNNMTIEINGQKNRLEDCIESIALTISRTVMEEKEKRTEDVLQECKILDSLSNALIAIRTN